MWPCHILAILFRLFGFLATKTLLIIWFSNLLTLSVPVEGYSRLSVPVEGYSRLSVHVEGYSRLSVPVEGYSRLSVPVEDYSRLSVPVEGYSRLSIPVEGYSRTVSCSLNLISMFLFIRYWNGESEEKKTFLLPINYDNCVQIFYLRKKGTENLDLQISNKQ